MLHFNGPGEILIWADWTDGDITADGKAKLLLEDKSVVDIGASALFKVAKFKTQPGSGGADRDVPATADRPVVPAADGGRRDRRSVGRLSIGT